MRLSNSRVSSTLSVSILGDAHASELSFTTMTAVREGGARDSDRYSSAVDIRDIRADIEIDAI